jgi:hypothetical protein
MPDVSQLDDVNYLLSGILLSWEQITKAMCVLTIFLHINVLLSLDGGLVATLVEL